MPLEDLVLRNRKTADSIRQLLGFDKQLEEEYNAENAQLAAYTNIPKDVLESQRESDPQSFHQQMAQYPSVAPEMHDSDIKAQQEQLVQDQIQQEDPYQETIPELTQEQVFDEPVVIQEPEKPQSAALRTIQKLEEMLLKKGSK